MERLVRHDERPTLAGLLVTDGGVEVDNDDRPAEGQRHQSGQVSPLSNATTV
jgi:hypothetical protein